MKLIFDKIPFHDIQVPRQVKSLLFINISEWRIIKLLRLEIGVSDYGPNLKEKLFLSLNTILTKRLQLNVNAKYLYFICKLMFL